MIAMDTKTNLTQEWLDKYESVKDKLQCKVDLDEYFTKSKVANMDVAILDLGEAHFPTGQIIACDPFIAHALQTIVLVQVSSKSSRKLAKVSPPAWKIAKISFAGILRLENFSDKPNGSSQ